MNHLISWLTPARRRWLYTITGAALALAGIYGLVDGQQIAGWMGLAAAVFGVAAVHTPAPELPRRALEDQG